MAETIERLGVEVDVQAKTQQAVSSIKSFAAQIELTKSKIADLTTAMNWEGTSSGQKLIDEAQLEKLKNLLADLEDKQIKVDVQQSDSSTPDNGNSGNTGSSGASLKSLAAGLIGIRSLYSLIRKLVGNNEQFTAAINNIIGTISNILEPALNFLARLLQTIATFIAKIFGVNVGTNKSSAKTAKNTAGFDEINNLSSNDSSDSGASVESFTDFEWMSPEVIEALKAALLGVAAALVAIKLGVDAITALGIGVIIAGIILFIDSVIAYLNDPSWNNFGNILISIGVILAGIAIALGAWPVAIAAIITVVLGLFAKFHDKIQEYVDLINGVIDNCITWIHENLTNSSNTILGILGAFLEAALSNVKNVINTVVTVVGSLLTGVKGILDGIIQIFKGDFKGGIKTILTSIWDTVKSLFNAGVSFISTKFNTIINLVGTILSKIGSKLSTGVKNIINKYIISPINRVINWVNEKLHFSYGGLSILGKQVIPSFDVQLFTLNNLPQLATGTNYVPNDMVAMLHKGEAVVPKKYNNNNNEETNALLRQLINVVDSKEFKAYISKNDVGKSAVDYINTQSRVLGRSVI